MTSKKYLRSNTYDPYCIYIQYIKKEKFIKRNFLNEKILNLFFSILFFLKKKEDNSIV